MVKLDINETSQSLAIFGGYLVFFGLVSFYFKERLYMCTLCPSSNALTFQPRR